MNERFKELAAQVGIEIEFDDYGEVRLSRADKSALEEFAELIVEECRNVVAKVYRNTPLELCGPLLTADEEIAEHFFGVES